MSPSILIRNGRVHDGAQFIGPCEVLIENDKIASVGQPSDINEADAQEVIDASGMVVCPGFIELHNMTFQVEQLEGNDAANLTAQGVTTCLTGNCGQSGQIESEDEFLGRIEFLRNARLGINVGMLLGHNSLRQHVLVDAAREASDEEVQSMCQFLERSMECGALGLSTGLMYAPGNFASADELTRLAGVVGQRDGLYTSHLRDEGDELCESVREALDTARAGDARLVISHLKATGARNWGKTRDVVSTVEQRRSEQEVYLTYYPYNATSTVLKIVVRPEILERAGGDLEQVSYNKADSELIRQQGLQNLCPSGWNNVVIVSSTRKELVGKSIGGLSEEGDPYRVVLKILRDDPGTRVVFHNIASEEEIYDIALLPYAIAVSDGYVYPTGATEATHPRNYGAFSRMIRHYSESGLQEFIYKATRLAARVLRLTDRGRIEAGCFADIAIFEPRNVRDRADYQHPCELAEGVAYTIVNGRVAYRRGQSTKQFAGRLIS